MQLDGASEAAFADERREFGRRWHVELQQLIQRNQERRETVLRASLPLVFGIVASSVGGAPTPADSLWRWLAAGAVLVLAVEMTHRATLSIIHAAVRMERLEKFDGGLPPFEWSIQNRARTEYEQLSVPRLVRRYWPRPGRSRGLALWYGAVAFGLIIFWFASVTGPSLEETAGALVLPCSGLVGSSRLLIVGRLHWRRHEIVADSRVFQWIEQGPGPSQGQTGT